jgi:Fe-S oxidoreductase
MSMSEYAQKRLEVGTVKAEQIRESGAAICATACHNCVDGLSDLIKKYDLKYDFPDGKTEPISVPTVGEIVANAIVIPKELPKTAREIRDEIKGKKILVIDDEPDFVAFIQALLEDNDFKVITSTSGPAGLEKAKALIPKPHASRSLSLPG